MPMPERCIVGLTSRLKIDFEQKIELLRQLFDDVCNRRSCSAQIKTFTALKVDLLDIFLQLLNVKEAKKIQPDLESNPATFYCDKLIQTENQIDMVTATCDLSTQTESDSDVILIDQESKRHQILNYLPYPEIKCKLSDKIDSMLSVILSANAAMLTRIESSINGSYTHFNKIFDGAILQSTVTDKCADGHAFLRETSPARQPSHVKTVDDPGTNSNDLLVSRHLDHSSRISTDIEIFAMTDVKAPDMLMNNLLFPDYTVPSETIPVIVDNHVPGVPEVVQSAAGLSPNIVKINNSNNNISVPSPSLPRPTMGGLFLNLVDSHKKSGQTSVTQVVNKDSLAPSINTSVKNVPQPGTYAASVVSSGTSSGAPSHSAVRPLNNSTGNTDLNIAPKLPTKSRVLISGTNTTSSLRAVQRRSAHVQPKKAAIFLSRLNPTTQIEDIALHLSKLNMQYLNCTRIKTKFDV